MTLDETCAVLAVDIDDAKAADLTSQLVCEILFGLCEPRIALSREMTPDLHPSFPSPGNLRLPFRLGGCRQADVLQMAGPFGFESWSNRFRDSNGILIRPVHLTQRTALSSGLRKERSQGEDRVKPYLHVRSVPTVCFPTWPRWHPRLHVRRRLLLAVQRREGKCGRVPELPAYRRRSTAWKSVRLSRCG